MMLNIDLSDYQSAETAWRYHSFVAQANKELDLAIVTLARAHKRVQWLKEHPPPRETRLFLARFDALVEFDRRTGHGKSVDIPISRDPVPMILFCPNCGLQHIDRPEGIWMNPPHRSHLCGGCGHSWRPADVPTTGVADINTRGKADSTVIIRGSMWAK